MKIRRKTFIVALSYALALAAVCGIFAAREHTRMKTYERHSELGYEHSFAELVSSMSRLDASLQKSLYASSPAMVSEICTEVFARALTAQMAMGQLPLSDIEFGSTASFVSRVGDYAYVLSRTVPLQDSLTDEQYANLSALSKAASQVTGRLNELFAEAQAGTLSIGRLKQAQRELDESENIAFPTDLSGGFRLIEEEFPEIPSLIYDGPFSEHMEQLQPLYLEDMYPVHKNAALEAAADFLQTDTSNLGSITLRGGNMPAYVISNGTAEGCASLEVTLKGGVVMSMFISHVPDEGRITQREAAVRAEEFLISKGYDTMEMTYYMTSGGVAIVNFAHTENGITVYPDLIKVWVALDTGKVVGFEADGYIMSHRERELPEPSVTADDAADKVSPHLGVISHRLAVIPTGGKNEVLCHEFKCIDSEERHCLVYINTETGAEEKILILLEDESGTLTI